MLKRTVAELSVAEYSFTGIETRPKRSDRDAIERAAIEDSSIAPGQTECGMLQRTRSIRTGTVPCHPRR